MGERVIEWLQMKKIQKKKECGQKIMFWENLNALCAEKGISVARLCAELRLSNSISTKWKRGALPSNATLKKIADYFGVTAEYLLGRSDGGLRITEDYTTFPVIGEIAAGYESIGAEDWSGETVDIPNVWLKGRKPGEFFVLSVRGDSMYPLYIEGDKVLILKCSTLDYPGQVGAVIYNDEYTTLKKVEYKAGEDWLTLVPVNPNYRPERIENEALEHCRVIGIPKLVIREIEE